MKYLTLIYYDTFARFFSAIEDETKKIEPNATFLHVAVFPSGCLYLASIGRKSKLLPLVVKSNVTNNLITTENELEKIIKYHLAIAVRHDKKKYRSDLIERANNYIIAWTKIVDEFQPDIVILSGDTRIAAESLLYVLDKLYQKNCNKFFFEQGPNGTTILDTKGVNANCSFRLSASNLTGQGFEPAKKENQERFKRNPIFRGFDHALIAILRPLGKLPPEWDTMTLDKYPQKKYQQCFIEDNIPRNEEILIALQVPDDANNIHHNPLNISDSDFLEMAMDAVQGLNVAVRVREHPLYRRRYRADLYNIINTSPNVFLSNQSLDEDFQSCSALITINSMTGLDAYLRCIPVITLGNSFYDHLPGIKRAASTEQLREALNAIRSENTNQIAKTNTLAIFSQMSSLYFIPGHYQDKDITPPARSVANTIKRINENSSVD